MSLKRQRQRQPQPETEPNLKIPQWVLNQEFVACNDVLVFDRPHLKLWELDSRLIKETQDRILAILNSKLVSCLSSDKSRWIRMAKQALDKKQDKFSPLPLGWQDSLDMLSDFDRFKCVDGVLVPADAPVWSLDYFTPDNLNLDPHPRLLASIVLQRCTSSEIPCWIGFYSIPTRSMFEPVMDQVRSMSPLAWDHGCVQSMYRQTCVKLSTVWDVLLPPSYRPRFNEWLANKDVQDAFNEDKMSFSTAVNSVLTRGILMSDSYRSPNVALALPQVPLTRILELVSFLPLETLRLAIPALELHDDRVRKLARDVLEFATVSQRRRRYPLAAVALHKLGSSITEVLQTSDLFGKAIK